MALDQDVIFLAQAIRETETGNRPVAGASGELVSRYQFMPDTWRGAAAKYLGDAQAPLTLENENKVAYQRIKEWKDQGLGPDQIAAAWNAGLGSLKDDRWKTNVGTNKMGVNFDTPGYVRKVGSAYERIKGQRALAQGAPPAQISSPMPTGAVGATIDRNPDAIARGVAKVARVVAPIGESVGLAAAVGGAKKMQAETTKIQQGLVDAAVRIIRNPNLSAAQKQRAMKAIQSSGGANVIEASGAFDETAGQTVGKGLQTLGSVLAGQGAGAVSRLELTGAKRLGASALAEGALSGVTTGLGMGLQTERPGMEALKTGAISAGLTAAVPVLGKIIGSVGKNTFAAFGGRPAAGLQHLFDVAKDDPTFTSKVFRQMANATEDSQGAVVRKVQDALDTIAENRDEAYRIAKKEIQARYRQPSANTLEVLDPDTGRWASKPFTIDPVKEKLKQTLSQFNISIKKSPRGATVFDFSEAPSFRNNPPNQTAVKRLYDDVMGWTDYTPNGLDRLRQTISEGFSTPSALVPLETAKKRLNAIIAPVKSELRRHINEILPEIGKMNNDYADASEFVKHVSKELSVPLSDKAAIKTAVTRLSNLFNPRSAYYREVVQELGETTAKDILTDIAVQNFKGWAPEGLGRYLSAGNIFAGGIERAAGAAVLGSPRIGAEAAIKAGQLSRVFGTETGQSVIAQLRNLALRGLSGDSTSP